MNSFEWNNTQVETKPKQETNWAKISIGVIIVVAVILLANEK